MVVKTAQLRRPPRALKLRQYSLDGVAQWPGVTSIYKSFLCLTVLPRVTQTCLTCYQRPQVLCSNLGLLSNRGTWVTSKVHGILHVGVGRVWWKGKRGERLPWALFLADGLLFSRPYTLATRILWSLEWTLDTWTKSENAPGREQCGTNKAKLVRIMTRGFSQSGEDS